MIFPQITIHTLIHSLIDSTNMYWEASVFQTHEKYQEWKIQYGLLKSFRQDCDLFEGRDLVKIKYSNRIMLIYELL